MDSDKDFNRLNSKRLDPVTSNAKLVILNSNMDQIDSLSLRELQGKCLFISVREADIQLSVGSDLGPDQNSIQTDTIENCPVSGSGLNFQVRVENQKGFSPHWNKEKHLIFRNGKSFAPSDAKFELVNTNLFSFNGVHLYVTNTPSEWPESKLYIEVERQDRGWIESDRLFIRGNWSYPNISYSRQLHHIYSDEISTFMKKLYNCPRGDYENEELPANPTGRLSDLYRRLSFLKISYRIYYF